MGAAAAQRANFFGKSYRDGTSAIGRPLVNSRAAFLALAFEFSTVQAEASEPKKRPPSSPYMASWVFPWDSCYALRMF